MTHDVLQSDIELATKLRDDDRPNEEIILALVQRGVDPAKAALLVDDLRSGRKATVQAALPPEFTLAHRSRSRSTARETGQKPTRRSPESASRRQPPAKPAAPARNKPGLNWLLVAALVVLVLAVLGIALFLHHHGGSTSPAKPAPKFAIPRAEGPARKAPAAVAAILQPSAPAPLALELQLDGLHIGASHVIQDNVFACLKSPRHLGLIEIDLR